MGKTIEKTPDSLDKLDQNNEVDFSRYGKKISVTGIDGTFAESDSVEANLLFEILKQLRKG